MEQTREASTTNLAERWCGQVARRDEVRVARRLYRKPLVDGVYPVDAGAVLNEFVHVLREFGIADGLEDVRGQGSTGERVPRVPYVRLYGLKTLCGIERMHALPEWLGSDEASRRLVGFNAHQVVFARDFVAGTDRWWLDPHGLLCVVPAQADLAVTADARGLAATSDGVPIGCRGHTVRHRQGKAAWQEWLEPEVVGMAGLTRDVQYGTPEPGGHRHRRDFQANPIPAVVVRQWHGKDVGPGGTTVCLTNASVPQPLQPFDDDDERRLIEHCCIKESPQPWSLRHSPQNTARAMRVHVVLTLLLFGLATAYRLRCEAVAAGTEPVGWQG